MILKPGDISRYVDPYEEIDILVRIIDVQTEIEYLSGKRKGVVYDFEDIQTGDVYEGVSEARLCHLNIIGALLYK